MAIFVAAFLFFLSVAIIAQNRQNILLVLTEDYRIRAANSANAALDLALHVMRHNPQWPSLLPGHSGELESGGSWRISSVSYIANRPHIIKIESRGSCGLFASGRTRYVEELAFGSASAGSAGGKNQPTHLFAYVKQNDADKLAVLTPDMRWQILGAVPMGTVSPRDEKQIPWLAAQGGPLFSRAPSFELSFELQDVGIANGQGVLKTINLPQNKDEQEKNITQPIVYLKANAGVLSWSDAKFPCHFGAGGQNIGSNPSGETAASGSGREQLTKYLDAEVHNLVYKGPTLEWYTTVGQGLAVNGSTVYCHGWHHYYQGTQATISGKGYLIQRNAKTYCAPALLCYSAEQDAWSVVMDMMTVTGRDTPPEIVPLSAGNTPCTNSLAYANGSLYCLAQSNRERILRASPTSWSGCASSAGKSLGLFGYKGQLLYHTAGTAGDMSNLTGLNAADPLKDLYLECAAVSLAGEAGNAVVSPNFKLYPSLHTGKSSSAGAAVSGGGNSVAVCGDNIYTFATFRPYCEEPSGGLNSLYPDLYESIAQRRSNLAGESVTGLVHYDGEGWQLWPSGLNDLAVSWNDCYGNKRLSLVYDKNTGQSAELIPGFLAAAYYPELAGGSASLCRYAVLLDQ
ncbi:hypothetical protein IJT17_04570 [bacterium]|nr:hypothetical protein [bacterium]